MFIKNKLAVSIFASVFLIVSGAFFLYNCGFEDSIFGNFGCVGEAKPAKKFPDENIKYTTLYTPPSDVKFGIEGISYDEFGVNYSDWFKNAKKRGISAVSLDPFNTEDGLTIIDSESLKEMGFVLDSDFPDALNGILNAAKKEGVEITLMIESLAHSKEGFLNPSGSIKRDKITPESVARFIGDLGVIAKEKGIKLTISEEAYDGEFLPHIARAAARAGIKYTHFFEDLNCLAYNVLSEDYGYYFKDLRNSAQDRERARKNLEIGSYYGELGFLNIMYGAARACGREFGTLTSGGWGLGAKTHQNIALMRSVQFAPSSVFFVLAEDAQGNTLEGEPEYVSGYDFSVLDKLIDRFGRKQSDAKKPIADFIVDMPADGEAKDYFDDALLSSASAITNSILASGFDLLVSKKPIPNADLYYVFGPGFVFGEGKDLSDELLGLKDKSVPVFYQVAGAISKELSPNWHSLFAYLGISNYTADVDGTGESEPVPLVAEAGFPSGKFKFNFAGYSLGIDDPAKLGFYSEAHTLHLIDPGSTNSEILLTASAPESGHGSPGAETALVVKKENVYFVNGSHLHFAAYPFLANLISGSPIFNEPAYAYVTAGRDRSVVFTAYDAKLDLNLPGGSNLTEFDENGAEVAPNSILDGGHLSGTLDKFHLLIVD